MRLMLGNTEIVVVGSDYRVPVTGRTQVSFLYHAALSYGSDKKAGEALGKSESTVRRGRQEHQSPAKKKKSSLSWPGRKKGK